MNRQISYLPATNAQINYIELLCNDIGCKNRAQSLNLCSNFVGRALSFFGDLSKTEASYLIEDLKRRKKEKNHDA